MGILNVKKAAKEIYDECKAYRNAGGAIVASRTDSGKVDVYHVFGTSAAGYQGDSAQKAFDRIIYRIELNEIDWTKPLLKFIQEELRAKQK